MSIPLILLVIAFLAFVVATFNPPAPKINLVALGLALVVAAELFGLGLFKR